MHHSLWLKSRVSHNAPLPILLLFCFKKLSPLFLFEKIPSTCFLNLNYFDKYNNFGHQKGIVSIQNYIKKHSSTIHHKLYYYIFCSYWHSFYLCCLLRYFLFLEKCVIICKYRPHVYYIGLLLVSIFI